MLIILVIVYLCSLQRTAVIDIHSFPLCEKIVHRPASLSMAVAGLLHPTEWQVGLCPDCRNIDISNAGFDIPHRYKRFVDITSVDRRRKSIDGVVENRNALVQRFRTDHWQ